MRILITIIISGLISNISAQTFGLKGGMAMTNSVGADVEDNSSRTGFYFGGFMKLSEDNSIQYMPNIIFHQKGGKTGSSSSGDELVLNYIDLGMNANFHINDELYLAVGPYFGYLVSAVSKLTVNGDTQSSSISDWDGWNRSEFGTNLGVGYNINDLFNVNFSYGLAFTDVVDDISERNTSIQIGIGYVFAY